MSDYICDTLIAEVFERLPPKSLIRFTSLSKAWGSRIASPHFISQQALRSANSRRKIIFQHEKISDRGSRVGMFWTLHSEGQWPFQMQGYARIPQINGPSANGWIAGSSNGVVCLYDFEEECFILWNPTIRHILNVPHDIDGLFGFGFDGVTNDHKIVTISDTKNGQGERERLVYSLSTGTWRAISSSPITPYVSTLDCCGSFVNGSFYWVVYCWETEIDWADFLLSFDLGNEVFGSIQLPEPYGTTRQVLSIKGALAVISFDLHGRHQELGSRIWIRRDDSWSIFYKVNIIEPPKVLALTTDDDLLFLFTHKEGLYLCNVATGERSRIVESGLGTYVIDMENFVENIQLLDKGAHFQ